MPKQRKIKHYRYGYSSRRQRRSRIWKGLLFILLLAVLVFIGYCVTKAVQNLVNRPEESSLPFSQAESLPPESSEASSGPESSSEPYEPVRASIRAIVMPKESMSSLDAAAAFLDSVDSSKYNSVAVELKDSSGILYYTSQVDLAKTCQAVSPSALDAAALAQLIRDKGFTPAARVYALQDDIASHTAYGTSYMYLDQASVTWLDRAADKGGKSWLNPYMEAAGSYLNAIVTEIAQFGYKAIVVNGIQYPNTANQRGMGLGPNASAMTTKEALEKIYTGMSDSAKAFDVPVIPAYKGECYKGERPQVYTVNPNEFTVYPASPIVGSDLTVLDAITAPTKDLIPTVDSADQIPALKEKGIEQYLVG